MRNSNVIFRAYTFETREKRLESCQGGYFDIFLNSFIARDHQFDLSRELHCLRRYYWVLDWIQDNRLELLNDFFMVSQWTRAQKCFLFFCLFFEVVETYQKFAIIKDSGFTETYYFLFDWFQQTLHLLLFMLYLVECIWGKNLIQIFVRFF